MEFKVLGALEVSADGSALSLGGKRQRLVLAHLILRANDVVSTDVLIDEVWGEDPPDSVRSTLQGYVSHLRRVLGERLEGRPPGYLLHVHQGELDAESFEALVRDAKRSLAQDPAKAASLFADALGLWRGAAAFADLVDESSLQGEIARLNELRLSATEHRIAAELATGRHSTMVSELEALTSRYPLRERLWAHLMVALYQGGRQAEALDAYQRARQVLLDELGADPSAELQRLNQQILNQDPELRSALAPAPVPAQTVRPSRGDLEPGTEFAGYRIEAVLGRGGMSVVYLAEHLALGRKVALKLLAPQLADDERFRERFVRESRIAAGMEHSNIVPIYEAGESEGILFIAMRYVPGTDLGRLIQREGMLDPDRALWIVEEVASALDAAHGRELVHRDVKPGNILVVPGEGSRGRDLVYLSDFGLTKRLEGGTAGGLTQTGQFVGTVDYVAPEQIEGRAVDARADVYSLACVLFECLTGKVPYERDTQVAALYAHLGEKPPQLTAARPELPAAVDAVLTKALSKAPAGRYPTGGEFAAAAREALRPTVETSVGMGGRSGWSGWRAAVGAAAAALITGVIVFSVSRGETPAAEGAVSPTATASPSPAPEPNFATIERVLTSEEERLLTYIPAAVGANCLPLDRAEPSQGPLAALVCNDEDVEVLYELFPSRAEMDQVFQINANINRAPEGECATDHLAVSSYTIDGEPSGRVLCYTRSIIDEFGDQAGGPARTSHIEWTDENSAVYAHAVRNDLGDLMLYEWWLSSSGPVVSAEGGGAAPSKDRPAAAATPPLREGSFLASVVEPDRAGGVNLRDANGQPLLTYRMHIEAGTYEFAEDYETVDSGTVLLEKPNLVVFDPLDGVCAGTGLLSGGPASYEVSTSGASLRWEFKEGGTCAGPDEVPPRIAWIRAPGGVLAFANEGQIKLMDAAGFGVEQLTGETRGNASPTWSPDGTRLVFAGAGLEGTDLYSVGADGNGLTQVMNEEGDELDPTSSPDGSLIAFVYNARGAERVSQPDAFRSSIVVADPDGTGWMELITKDDESLGWPAWSPDGRRLAFTGFGDGHFNLYVMGADGSNLTKVREEPAGTFGLPLSWTPDGERVVFWGRLGGGRQTLLSMRPDGSDIREFMESFPRSPFFGEPVLDWSPDGRWIVMAGVDYPEAGGTLALLVRADGSDVFTIGAFVTDPTWRPETP